MKSIKQTQSLLYDAMLFCKNLNADAIIL